MDEDQIVAQHEKDRIAFQKRTRRGNKGKKQEQQTVLQKKNITDTNIRTAIRKAKRNFSGRTSAEKIEQRVRACQHKHGEQVVSDLQQVIRISPAPPPSHLKILEILSKPSVTTIQRDNNITQQVVDYLHSTIFNTVCGESIISVK